MKYIAETFDYHINWKSRGHHPGQHKSDQRGMGIEFAGHATLIDYPDPRRIDIRQTMRDPIFCTVNNPFISFLYRSCFHAHGI